MNKKTFSAILTLLCLLVFSLTAIAQEKGQVSARRDRRGGLSNLTASVQEKAQDKAPKPETISTGAKLVVTKLKIGEGDAFDVRGKATFTVTAANVSDDTVAGTIVYTIPVDARRKVAEISGKPLAQVPESVTVKDAIASFQKATSCPTVLLEFSPMDIDIAGVKSHFNRFVLEIKEDFKGLTSAQQEMVKLFCVWTNQIKLNRQRRGVIARVNGILNGEPDPNMNTGMLR
jgi:hypothetical protein